MAALQIDNPRAQELAAELARRTGESVEDAVIRSLELRLAREDLCAPDPDLVRDLKEIARRSAALPVHDHRSDEEILGYNDNGMFA